MHESFVKMTGGKELIAKAVITGTTDIDDIKRMSRILSVSGDNVTVVLQPVTPVNNAVTVPDEEMIYYFKEYIKKETGKNTMILGQLHYCLGIK